MNKTFKKIKEVSDKAKEEVTEIKLSNEKGEAINKIISEASKVISDEMIVNIKVLAKLANADFEDVLSSLLKASNDFSMMQDESIQSVIKEATEIYEKGESAFKEFETMFVLERS